MTVLIANPTKTPYNKHCAWCVYQHIQKQVQGLAKMYIRKAPSNHSGQIDGNWMIYIVPKGRSLKDIMNDGHWSVLVVKHPFKEKINHEQTRS